MDIVTISLSSDIPTHLEGGVPTGILSDVISLLAGYTVTDIEMLF
jgi:hypothetical protein